MSNGSLSTFTSKDELVIVPSPVFVQVPFFFKFQFSFQFQFSKRSERWLVVVCKPLQLTVFLE
jgi:hypothetical protein